MAMVLTEALHRYETHPVGIQTILTQLVVEVAVNGIKGEGIMPAGLTVEVDSVDLTKALRDWGRRRGQLEAGEITKDEYRDRKDSYQPRILLEPVTGEEIDDPYTGRRLEGVEREGASRDVRTMWWLNGDM